MNDRSAPYKGVFGQMLVSSGDIARGVERLGREKKEKGTPYVTSNGHR